jgi:hypothetical protein
MAGASNNQQKVAVAAITVETAIIASGNRGSSGGGLRSISVTPGWGTIIFKMTN